MIRDTSQILVFAHMNIAVSQPPYTNLALSLNPCLSQDVVTYYAVMFQRYEWLVFPVFINSAVFSVPFWCGSTISVVERVVTCSAPCVLHLHWLTWQIYGIRYNLLQLNIRCYNYLILEHITSSDPKIASVIKLLCDVKNSIKKKEKCAARE